MNGIKKLHDIFINIVNKRVFKRVWITQKIFYQNKHLTQKENKEIGLTMKSKAILHPQLPLSSKLPSIMAVLTISAKMILRGVLMSSTLLTSSVTFSMALTEGPLCSGNGLFPTFGLSSLKFNHLASINFCTLNFKA